MMLKLTTPKSINLTLELDRLGVPTDHRVGELSVYQFPEVISEEYIPAWEEFIKTDAIKELYSLASTNIQGIFYAALSFVSYVNTVSSNPFASDFSGFTLNRKQLEGTFGIIAERYKHSLHRKRFKQFKVSKKELVLNDTTHVLANGFVGLSGNVIITYQPAKRYKLKQGTFTTTQAKNDLDSILYSNSSYLFGGSSVPPKMLGKTVKLGNGKTKTTFPNLNNLKKVRPHLWHELQSYPLPIYCLRTDENSFALRVPFELPVVYLAYNKRHSFIKQEVERTIFKMLGI